MALLGRLNVNSAFLIEFTAILREQWDERTQDSAVQVPRLRAQLKEQQELQEKLVTAYLRGDKAILPIFERMNGKFEDDIAALESQITEAQVTQATFEQLLDFSKTMLGNISMAWAHADLHQKQKVQNILFPEGLKYHPTEGILNSENKRLLSAEN